MAKTARGTSNSIPTTPEASVTRERNNLILQMHLRFEAPRLLAVSFSPNGSERPNRLVTVFQPLRCYLSEKESS